MPIKLYFVGAGKMATALAAGVVRQGVFRSDEVGAYDINPASRQSFEAATGVQCDSEIGSRFSEAEAVLLAVKPQVAEAAVAALPPLRDGALVITICAGLSISKVSRWFKTDKVVRVMPNTPLMVGCGASCYAPGAGADEASEKLVASILGSLGIAHRVEEPQLDAVTALSGSGPAYFFEMIQALTDAGVNAGLDADLALELSVQTMAGSAEMLKRKMGTPDELRIAVTSPHGTTEAGLEVMGKAEFRKMMDGVVQAARNRSIELGK